MNEVAEQDADVEIQELAENLLIAFEQNGMQDDVNASASRSIAVNDASSLPALVEYGYDSDEEMTKHTSHNLMG